MPWLLFAIYLCLGPLPWLVLLLIGHFAGARMSRVQEACDVALPTSTPTLMVLVPAKDEAASIETCISSIVKLDYPRFDVIAIDDRSTDGTGETLERIAAEMTLAGNREGEAPAEPMRMRDSARPDRASAGSAGVSPSRVTSPGTCFKALRIRELPPGWLGKCHALHVATRDVATDWLLFVDSDMTVTPDAARHAVAICEERGWDALSLLPALHARSFWERLLLPLLAVSWAAAFRVSQTNDDSRPDRAFASGGFFLIRRAWYERVGGHAAVRDQIVEDIMLMRTLKRAGAKVRLQFGQHLVGARMHATLDEIFRGWARILAGTTSRRAGPLLAVATAVAVTSASLVPALILAVHSTEWLAAACGHAALMAVFAARVYYVARQRLLLAALLPVAVPTVLCIYANAIRVCLTGRVAWRGTNVDVR